MKPHQYFFSFAGYRGIPSDMRAEKQLCLGVERCSAQTTASLITLSSGVESRHALMTGSINAVCNGDQRLALNRGLESRPSIKKPKQVGWLGCQHAAGLINRTWHITTESQAKAGVAPGLLNSLLGNPVSTGARKRRLSAQPFPLQLRVRCVFGPWLGSARIVTR